MGTAHERASRGARGGGTLRCAGSQAMGCLLLYSRAADRAGHKGDHVHLTFRAVDGLLRSWWPASDGLSVVVWQPGYGDVEVGFVRGGGCPAMLAATQSSRAGEQTERGTSQLAGGPGRVRRRVDGGEARCRTGGWCVGGAKESVVVFQVCGTGAGPGRRSVGGALRRRLRGRRSRDNQAGPAGVCQKLLCSDVRNLLGQAAS